MKGFKPTGYGPSSGFKFPSRMGFTGSTGTITTVSPYTRRKFASGGFVRQDNPRMKEDSIGDQGSALVRRARSSTALDQESGGKTAIRPGFKRGGGACMSDGGNWIAGATKNKGALHRALGVPEGEKIPAKKMARAAHSSNPTMRKRATLAKTLGRMHKADGGDVKVPRRKTPYTFGQSLRAVPEFVGSLPAMVKDAIVDAGRRKLSDVQQDVSDTKRRRIDSIVDADYARGGKAKRMGYQGGGLSTMFARVLAQKANNQRPPVTRQMVMNRMPRGLTFRSSGGSAKRMGYANGGRRDGLVMEKSVPSNGGQKGAPKPPAKPLPPAATIKEKFYAHGGGVSVKQAKEIAERTIGEHVRYPAPKGHKGLEKVMRRN